MWFSTGNKKAPQGAFYHFQPGVMAAGRLDSASAHPSKRKQYVKMASTDRA